MSGCLHGCVLAWVILGRTGGPPEREQSLYDREIRPYEKKIVWYNLQEKLPEVAPENAQADARPPRAREKATQAMVAGAKDDARAAALIWTPEPEIVAPKEVPLPNVVAVAPKVVRPFLVPAEKPAEPPAAAALPEAPNVTAADLKAALPLPPVTPKVVRPFLTPAVKAAAPAPAAALPEAPNVAAADLQAALPLPEATPAGPRRAFTPPPNVRMQKQAVLPLPEGPQAQMVVEPDALPFAGAGPRPQARPFTPPKAKPRAGTAVGLLPAAPELTAASTPKGGLDKVPRGYSPGRAPTRPEAAPAIPAEPPPAAPGAGTTGRASLAIVGLNPAKTTEVPAALASRAAGFSGGPEPRAEGSTGANVFALVNVPGLVVNNGPRDTQPTMMATFSPTSRENLLAAARTARGTAPKVPAALGGAYAPVPDPRFAGRVVYTMAVQMPNVTSFSGSWMVWFAERVADREPGAAPRVIRPPEVVRKVDPKYVAAAAADRVEGTVRLFGVIGKDGHVGGIVMLRQLDDRLDRSAREALAKWEFTPALRDGVPVDVDAIFEIPFHLAPRPAPKSPPKP